MYAIDFEVNELPRTPNELLGCHWRVRAGEAKRWERLVWRYVWTSKPERPLMRAELKLTRISSGRMDRDNLRSSFKSVIDGLVKCGILADDSPDHIGEPVVVHERGAPKQGRIRVEVREITKEQTDEQK